MTRHEELYYHDEYKGHNAAHYEIKSDLFLKVVSLPLFNALFIQFFESHYYWLELLEDEKGSYLVMSEWNGAELKPVKSDVLPFDYKSLIDVCHQDNFSQLIASVLQKPLLFLLARCGTPLSRLIELSRVSNYDYPLVYILTVANAYKQLPDQPFDITKELLAYCLCEPALSTGQLKAMRKLDARSAIPEVNAGSLQFEMPHTYYKIGAAWEYEDLRRNIYLACSCIAHHWSDIKHVIVHEKIIDLRFMNFIANFICNERYKAILGWCSYRSVCEHMNKLNIIGSEEVDTLAAEIVVQWFFLRRCLRISPERCKDIEALQALYTRSLKNYAMQNQRQIEPLGGSIYMAIMPMVSDRLHAKAETYLIESWENQVNELQFDDHLCLPVSERKPSPVFIQILTIGGLRHVSRFLGNCAWERIPEALKGEAEFWLYLNSSPFEVALVQLKPSLQGKAALVEFNGMANRGVSRMAKTELRKWLKG